MSRRKSCLLPAAAMLLAVYVMPASGQVICQQGYASGPIRSTGLTEYVGDLVFFCQGGTPTPAGLAVPQITIDVALNANITSLITAHGAASVTGEPGADFNEALLLVDEPNYGAVNVQGLGCNAPGCRPAPPLLNCGNIGAPDNGPTGPGVCSIISDGNPAQTYDGTLWVPAAACQPTNANGAPNPGYGCGRPNAFQGRTTSQPNHIQFLDVPFDPPAPGQTRVLRIVNMRANVAGIGAGGHAVATYGFSGPLQFMFAGPSQAFDPGIVDSLTASATSGMLHLAASPGTWHPRNVAFPIANGTAWPQLDYLAPEQNYPPAAAQNVPSLFVSGYEDGFQWQNDGVNGPLPASYFLPAIMTNTNYPLYSAGYGGLDTGINNAGVSSAGTRIAVVFEANGGEVTVPNEVYLHQTGCAGFPCPDPAGVMVLTTTDLHGAGPFTSAPGSKTTIHGVGMVVYEVLDNPAYHGILPTTADIPVTITGTAEILAIPLLAPFYTSPAAGFATPTAAHPEPTALPRFATDVCDRSTGECTLKSIRIRAGGEN